MEHEETGRGAPRGSRPAFDSAGIELPRDRISVFFPLLQRGVEVPADLGGPLKELLCGQFGIDEEYVTGRITTIFLDNRPVDDLERTLIHEGARVTLSAAMPGLVGATMRRSGFYAAFRQGISYEEEGGELQGGEGVIRLKLFNLLLPELGPLILGRGVILHPEQVEILRNLPAGGSDMPAAPAGVAGDSRRVLLKVTCTG